MRELGQMTIISYFCFYLWTLCFFSLVDVAACSTSPITFFICSKAWWEFVGPSCCSRKFLSWGRKGLKQRHTDRTFFKGPTAPTLVKLKHLSSGIIIGLLCRHKLCYQEFVERKKLNTKWPTGVLPLWVAPSAPDWLSPRWCHAGMMSEVWLRSPGCKHSPWQPDQVTDCQTEAGKHNNVYTVWLIILTGGDQTDTHPSWGICSIWLAEPQEYGFIIKSAHWKTGTHEINWDFLLTYVLLTVTVQTHLPGVTECKSDRDLHLHQRTPPSTVESGSPEDTETSAIRKTPTALCLSFAGGWVQVSLTVWWCRRWEKEILLRQLLSEVLRHSNRLHPSTPVTTEMQTGGHTWLCHSLAGGRGTVVAVRYQSEIIL